MMEQRNEPSTAEIVKALRCNPENSCFGCPYCITVSWCQEDGTADTDCNDKVLYYDAADRLEQLERENAELKRWHEESIKAATDSIVALEHQVSDLTARAEKAEAERDAAVAEIKESYAFSTGEDGEPIYTILRYV